MPRPSKYKPEYAEQAKKLCQIHGAVDVELAEFFEVNVSTIYEWKLRHEAFSEALQVGKAPADDRVEMSLYHRAIGYSHPEEVIKVVGGEIKRVDTVKHYPPDTKAALAWLYNRRPDSWHPLPREGLSPDEMGQIIEVVRATKDN